MNKPLSAALSSPDPQACRPAPASHGQHSRAVIVDELERLPRLIGQAAAALTEATTAAEVLDARDQASVVYDAAKRAARLVKTKDAHDTVIAACHKMQADALIIETRAQCRLADEYDAAQDRGEVQKPGGDRVSNVPDKNNAPKVADIGLTRRQVHEARQVRYAEKREPGIVNRTLDAKLKAGKEPTRADVKRAVRDSISPEPERRDGSRAANATKAAPGKTLTVSEATKALIGALGREYPERADVEHQLSRLYTRCIAKMFPGQLMRRPQEMVLREQNDRLHDEVERLRDEVERLRDEVERLRASRAPSAADQEYPELPRCLRRVS